MLSFFSGASNSESQCFFSIEMTVIRKQFMDNLRYYLCVMYRISVLCACLQSKKDDLKRLHGNFFKAFSFFFWLKIFICLWLFSLNSCCTSHVHVAAMGRLKKEIFLFTSSNVMLLWFVASIFSYQIFFSPHPRCHWKLFFSV